MPLTALDLSDPWNESEGWKLPLPSTAEQKPLPTYNQYLGLV